MSILSESNRNKKYIGMYKQFFTMKVPEGTENAVTRTNKEGNMVTEMQFTCLTGKLVDIITKNEGIYGRAYQFVISDGEEEVVLEALTKSNIATVIINRLPNINLKEDFEIHSQYNAASEKVYYNMFQVKNGEEVRIDDYFQHWDDVAKEWVREHKFPAWVQDDEGKWDAVAQRAYQKKVVDKYFAFKVPTEDKREELPPMPDAEHYAGPTESGPTNPGNSLPNQPSTSQEPPKNEAPTPKEAPEELDDLPF